jgi:hypothetical protein
MSEKASISISLCAAAGGFILTAVAGILYFTLSIDVIYVLLFWGIAAVFQVAGLIACRRQRHTTTGKAGVILACLGLSAMVMSTAAAFLRYIGFFGMTLVPAILMGVIAGLVFEVSQTKGLVSRWKAMIAAWLLPAIWFGLFWAFPAISGKYGEPSQVITGAASILCGPWATLAAKLGNWPNAGEFFNLTSAAVMTVLLVLLAASITWIKKASIVSLGLIFYAAFIWVWSMAAVIQLLNCVS